MRGHHKARAAWSAFPKNGTYTDREWNMKCAIQAAAEAKSWAEASQRWEEAGYKVRYNDETQLFEVDDFLEIEI